MEEPTTTEEPKPEAEAPPPSLSLTSDATKSLLSLLLKRGYLHDGVDPIQAGKIR